MTDPPLVTIGIPTFNRSGDLARALDSALGQEYPRLDVVVSDNASTDGTRTLCEARAAEDPRLRYVRQTSNVGPQANWRAVLDLARGDYFMWHADDDSYSAAFVAKAVAHLVAHPDTLLCFSDYRQVDEAGNEHGTWHLPHLYPDRDWTVGRRDFFRYPYTEGTVSIYGLYRTALLRRIGHPKAVTFRRLVSGSEAPFLAEVARRGRITVLPEVLFHYNNHALARESLAHTGSRRLGRLDKALLYATIHTRLFAKALRAKAPMRERLDLAATTLGAAVSKLSARDGSGRSASPPGPSGSGDTRP